MSLKTYPRLNELLRKNKMTVTQLHREMQRLGFKVNVKTLYRLRRDEPVENLNMAAATGICQVLHLGLNDLVQTRAVETSLQRLSEEKQQRLDELMDRNTEGLLTKRERKEFQRLVEEAEAVTLANARLLVQEKRRLSR